MNRLIAQCRQLLTELENEPHDGETAMALLETATQIFAKSRYDPSFWIVR